LGVLLGTAVTVVFVETGFALWGAAHVVNGVLNTPKTALMLAVRGRGCCESWSCV
jgi:hypothetical protein